MTLQFKKAERIQQKLRLCIGGPSGSGKTYSALMLAQGIKSPNGKIAMIDTERGSGQLYAHLCEYDVLTLPPPFTPKNYVDAINAAVEAGYEVLIIDSLTHAWTDEGGMLDQVDKKGGSSFNAWKDITPQHRALINALIGVPIHIVATVRTKTHYDVEEYTDGRGNKKTRPVKVGLKPEFREGIEYEFTAFMEINHEHNAVVTKDRTNMFADEVFRPTKEIGERFLKWLSEGRENPAHDPNIKVKQQIATLLKKIGRTPKTAEEAVATVKELTQLDLGPDTYNEVVGRLAMVHDDMVAAQKEAAANPPKVEEAAEIIP